MRRCCEGTDEPCHLGAVHIRVLVAVAFLASPAPGHLARQAAALSRLPPVRAQRTPTRQSPARRPNRYPRQVTQANTPEADKSHAGYRSPL